MNKVIIILTILLISCSGQEIDFPNGRSEIVVEGWVTTEEKQHWVKLSQTVGFLNSQSEVPIEDAIVSIEDNVANTYSLTHQDDGLYLSDVFQGTIGRQYSLSIELSNGDVINSSPERLNPAPSIDQIGFDSFTEQDPDTGEDVEIFFPIVTTNDPPEEDNYYRYKGYRNGNLLNLPNELEILNDQFINGQELAHNIASFRYSLGDNARVELHSLSRSGFNFLELLKLQTTSLGSSSGTAPATLIGNLTYQSKNEIVLGLFGASDVKSISDSVQ